jgi:hypothetical protein
MTKRTMLQQCARLQGLRAGVSSKRHLLAHHLPPWNPTAGLHLLEVGCDTTVVPDSHQNI